MLMILNVALDPSPKQPTTSSALRKDVMQLLNNKYGRMIFDKEGTYM